MTRVQGLKGPFEQGHLSQLVTPKEFVGHLTGRSQLERADDPEANLVGLMDRETGLMYVVSYSELAKYHAQEQRGNGQNRPS